MTKLVLYRPHTDEIFLFEPGWLDDGFGEFPFMIYQRIGLSQFETLLYIYGCEVIGEFD